MVVMVAVLIVVVVLVVILYVTAIFPPCQPGMTDYHPCLPIPTGLTSGQVHAREVGPWKPTYKHLVMTMWPMVSNALMISGILLLILDSVMSSGDKRALYSRLLHLEPSLLVVMGLFLANFISTYWTGFWDSKPFLRTVWVM